MFPEPTVIVLTLYGLQGLISCVIALILRKFYLSYKNSYFQYWYWSWIALVVVSFGSTIALINAFFLAQDNIFRIVISTLTITASLVQYFWLYAGSIELSYSRKISKKRFYIFSAVAILLSLVLVLIYYTDPSKSAFRLFLRVGIKSLIGFCAFTLSAITIFKIRKTGVGIKLIIIAFLLYGLESLNYFFIHLSGITDFRHPLGFPYYIGAIDLFILSLIGLGMVMSMLEVERFYLKKVNKELDTFLYRASHDLRSPLTTISGIVYAIRNTDKISEKEDFLGLIESRVEQADNAIKDIITLRKEQKMGLSIEKVDLKKEVEECYHNLAIPSAKKPELVLKTEGSTIIRTDVLRIRTIVENLISNAFKYHKYEQPNPIIEVLIRQVGSTLELIISDNGQGIDKKHLSSIFDMFYRANRESLGTGLGLYLVKEAVEKIGGSIEVKSELNKGTTFYIKLLKRSK